MLESILCYVDGPWAYFTTQPLADQWGDDWDDAPYEHNAGEPYEPIVYHFVDGTEKNCPEHFNADGTPKWRVFKIAWSGVFQTPDYNHSNSPYSVQSINQGAAPWLRTAYREPEIVIPAGTELNEFVHRILCGGGEVYLPHKWTHTL